ncbi:MAG: cation:proton antiporter [Leifsonia sp.]
MELIVIGVLGVLAIAAASQAASKVGVATPLLLVLLGIGVSIMPFVPDFEIKPEWILAGVLPPLLYSAAVSMPTMDFQRNFRAIAGLSVILVVLSSVLLGLLFAWLIPGLDLAIGIALGAIVSPTDAVATSIVKKLGVSPRIVTVLEGESLLNDATALVLLRTAIAATATAVSFWGVIGQFAYAVAIAVVIGVVVGWANLRIRHRVKDATVNTAISFTIPFIASIPAEALGASGLVAAVAAGLVTGSGAARWLTPSHRLSDVQNWRTVELLLEGAVFLVMGLELSAILDDVSADGSRFAASIGVAAIAFVALVFIRAAFVVPLLYGLSRSAAKAARRREGLASLQERLDGMQQAGTKTGDEIPRGPGGRMRSVSPEAAARFRERAVRFVADVEYLQAAPLGVREGVVVVWAGMRGVVTLAAAQTLPQETPSRSMLVLIAFVVAAASLLIQGGTIAAVARRLGITGIAVNQEERQRLSDELRVAAMSVVEREGIDMRALARSFSDDDDDQDVPTPQPDMERFRGIRLAMIEAQRSRLLDLQRAGTYSSGTLTWALESLDADQISIELRAPENGSD